jgi:hypothetical protein
MSACLRPARAGAGLFGGNDQAELGSIELSSMTKISFFWNFRFLSLVFVCYLEFIIWCLTGILKKLY